MPGFSLDLSKASKQQEENRQEPVVEKPKLAMPALKLPPP